MLEKACRKACQFSQKPSYNSVKNVLQAMETKAGSTTPANNNGEIQNRYGITRGADYYGGGADHAE